MGMYGMGGVGKTTLLMQINNKFSEERCGFDFVIWVVVSKELHVEKIQDEIAQKVDDIWEKVDLTEIGVPFPAPENRCKVVFTTRKTSDSDPEIPKLAKDVARKCGGLPLALNVIGETMSCKKTVEEWRHAINVLTSYATEFSGMEDKILPLLKYSYDNLKGEDVKSCLLYRRAENKGYEIIGDLVRASLLMEELNKTVRMHDVVREMALWIASELGREKEAFIVHAGVGLNEIPKVKNWNSVRRMSLMKNKIRNLAGSPECLELTAFLMQRGELVNISSEFFKSMPKLQVLDLSFNEHLTKVPDGVSDLVSLKYLNLSDTGIRHLPKGLQELKKLIHLNLEVDELYTISGILKLESNGIAIPVTMNKLRYFSIERCTILR
ncbi:unnamed protein product [Microthlaspi erraticum]|uniref:NB-ARC domain-containing protein n=1 Tax=Microthlaspi erraticum TaxID=1685480 RepID=A0A6D2J509_9BRAS|nr:unnamed protein product [Microthlaspi erraticum]